MLTTIIGHRGFIGSHLLKSLVRDGAELFLPEKDNAALQGRFLGNVYYCAGLTADFSQKPMQTAEAHVGTLARILDSGKFERLVYLSSTRLYDSLGGVEVTEDADLSLNPANPRHLFDLSKALGEGLCINAGGGRALVARLSSVYSDEMHEPNFLSSLIRQCMEKNHLELASSPSSARDYIHVDDAIAILKAMIANGKGGIYNVASGINIENQRIFETLQRLTGCEIVAAGTQSGPWPVIRIDRIRSEFAAQPRSLDARIEGIVQRLLSARPAQP